MVGPVVYFCARIARYASIGLGEEKSGYCVVVICFCMVDVMLKVKYRS